MPRPRKLFTARTMIFVTFRTEEGLPFVPLEFMNEIIWSALARAQKLYPVQVCALNFEPNHAHLAIFVENPELVPLFVGYVKQETAHAINRLLGRRRKTVWAEDYDSPTVLDYDKALEKIVYLLLNPVKDGLIDSVEHYPGVSSWKLFSTNRFVRKCRALSRTDIPRLNDPHHPWKENGKILRSIGENNSVIDFVLSPYAWKNCFEETRNLTDHELRALIITRVAAEAARLNTERNGRKPSPRAQDLQRQSILKQYTPKSFGRRMVCLSSFKHLRQRFIAGYKSLCEKASWVLSEWRSGNLAPLFPVGLFPPCLPRRGNLISLPI